MVFFNSGRCFTDFDWAEPYPSVLLLTTQRLPAFATATTSGLSGRASFDISFLLLFFLWSCSCHPVTIFMLLQVRTEASWGNTWFLTSFGAACHFLCFLKQCLDHRQRLLQYGRALLGLLHPATAELDVPAEGFTCVAHFVLADLNLWPSAHRGKKTSFISSFVPSIFIPLQSVHDSLYQFGGIPCCWLISIAINISCLPWGRISLLFITFWLGFHLPSKPEQLF